MPLKLALNNPAYEVLACKFYEHFLWIAGAMDRMGEHEDEMWDEEDGFFYDLLRLPDGSATRLKVRSMVGLLSLCASTVFPHEALEKLPKFRERAVWFTQNHPELMANIVSPAVRNGRHLLSLLDESKLRKVLARLLDEDEFLSPYGIRSLSRYHLEHPYVFNVERSGIPSELPSRRVRQRDVRGQLQLARSHLVPDQCAAGARASEPIRLLRR